MKKLFVGLLSLVVFVGCSDNEEEPESEEIETEEPEEVEESEEDSLEEENEADQDPFVALLEQEVASEPVRVTRSYWNDSDEVEMEIDLEIGPFIQDEEYAVLPITASTESEGSVQLNRLFGLGVGSGEGIGTERGLAVRIFDPEALTASQIAVIEGEAIDSNNLAIQTFTGEGSRNQQQTISNDREEPVRYFATFAKTDAESISVMMEKMGVVEDVPVVERENSGYFTATELAEVAESLEEGQAEEVEALAEEHNLADRIVPSSIEMLIEEIPFSPFEDMTEIGEEYREAIQAREVPLEQYSTALESSLSRIDEIDHSTLILSSDVLFEFDESALTDEADAELEAAIRELEGVEGGELEIVGHTDNEHTEEYNQTLSEERADSVYNRLDDLTDLSVFDEVTTRGESFREPIADNESEEGRAQNRRVELHFTPPTEQVEIVSDDEVPEAFGAEASYPEAAETDYGNVEVESVRRVGNTFVGTVRISPNSEGNFRYQVLTQQPGIGSRGWHEGETLWNMQWTAYAITLIHNGRRYYPLDYYLEPLPGFLEDTQEEENVEYVLPLAEQYVTASDHPDSFTYATFVWPAFDVDEVIVDKQLSFHYYDSIEETVEWDTEYQQPWRVTNVPVTDGESIEEADSEEDESEDEDAETEDDEENEENDEDE